MFDMLSRFLEVKDHLIVVLDELEWDSLTPMQWRDIFNSKSPTTICASHKYHWCRKYNYYCYGYSSFKGIEPSLSKGKSFLIDFITFTCLCLQCQTDHSSIGRKPFSNHCSNDLHLSFIVWKQALMGYTWLLLF